MMGNCSGEVTCGFDGNNNNDYKNKALEVVMLMTRVLVVVGFPYIEYFNCVL